MLVSRTNLSCILAACLVLLAPLKTTAADILIGGVPVPEAARPGEGSSPFLGAWFGTWGASWRTVLVVESVEDDTITATYAVGPLGNFPGGNWPLKGRIKGNSAALKGADFSIDIALDGEDKARARYNRDQGFSIFNRGDLSSLHPWSAGKIEMLTTDLVEGGSQINLEVVIFKPEGNGPFPLAVMNHGSTGRGNDPAIFGETWTAPWLADVLVSQGWLVAFPQRRGRGGSDGLYDEGFTDDRSQYTCELEQTLKGADRALGDISAAIKALRQHPDVETSPILIGGVSRGGALSVAWAGRNPSDAHGVVNFVGGWLGEGCGDAARANRTLFASGGAYPKDTLWLYGENDSFYSLPFSRENFAAFKEAGGKGAFHAFTLSERLDGHWVNGVPIFWEDLLIDYLDRL